MRKRIVLQLLIVFVLLVVFTGSIYAETFTNDKAGVQFDLPGGWKYEYEGDLFMAMSPDESVLLIFYAARKRRANNFMDTMAAELDGIVDDVEFNSEPYEERIHGLTQIYVEGTGFYGREQVDLDLTMVVGARRSLVIIGLGDIDGKQRKIDRIYSSIRRY